MTLAEFRADKGWTLAQMGARLGVSDATVSRLENGKQRPSYQLLLRIMKLGKGDVDIAGLGKAKAA